MSLRSFNGAWVLYSSGNGFHSDSCRCSSQFSFFYARADQEHKQCNNRGTHPDHPLSRSPGKKGSAAKGKSESRVLLLHNILNFMLQLQIILSPLPCPVHHLSTWWVIER
jgi:hypothetical protein